jgi:hypothetical protein
MIEDKLTHDERVRLEALAQAIARNATMRPAPTVTVLEDAKRFEQWIRDGAVAECPAEPESREPGSWAVDLAERGGLLPMAPPSNEAPGFA